MLARGARPDNSKYNYRTFLSVRTSPGWIGQNVCRQVTLSKVDEFASAPFESVGHAERAISVWKTNKQIKK